MTADDSPEGVYQRLKRTLRARYLYVPHSEEALGGLHLYFADGTTLRIPLEEMSEAERQSLLEDVRAAREGDHAGGGSLPKP